MAACLAELGAIVLKAGDDFWRKDCSIRPEFRVLAAARLEELLDSKSGAEEILGVLGWG
jgi:hypothetical protein